jgi:hypothetical protein
MDPIMTTGFLAEHWHRHDHRCYWDHTRCGWVCPAEEVTEAETRSGERYAPPGGYRATGAAHGQED